MVLYCTVYTVQNLSERTSLNRLSSRRVQYSTVAFWWVHLEVQLALCPIVDYWSFCIIATLFRQGAVVVHCQQATPALASCCLISYIPILWIDHKSWLPVRNTLCPWLLWSIFTFDKPVYLVWESQTRFSYCIIVAPQRTCFYSNF